MKKTNRILAVTLGSLMTIALFAGCNQNTEGDPYVASETSTRICYDNLGANYVAVSDTQYRLELKQKVDEVEVIETDASGNAVTAGSVALYDADANTLTAVGQGVVTLSLKKGEEEVSSVRVECVPAYATDPNNQYDLTSAKDFGRDSSSLLGGTHDPSLIEVTENGVPTYYIFSTGWAEGNEIRKSTDLIHWKYMGKATSPETEIDEIEEWIGDKNNAYGGVQWWAPDIVEAYGGGYWLYTCCVGNDYKVIDGQKYSMACIVLFYSDTLERGSFEYQGVLMQSCIPNTTAGEIDVNSIDPQIIYDPAGNMYMAYGSFGTGNWMLELNPKTGLRKDDVYKNGTFYDWEEIRAFRNEATSIYNKFQTEDVSTNFYGKMISLKAMEAPVIARHDNVVVSDEKGVISEAKTYYYSMHSYNGLAVAYMMWGGRSESVWGKYMSTSGKGIVYNLGQTDNSNQGNKYMGTFSWTDQANTGIDIKLPGHNDLFTTSSGTNIAAYITRTDSWAKAGIAEGTVFLSQTHQYYLNSLGNIVINPNRYGGEIDRGVTKEELLHFTEGNKFKMVCLYNSSANVMSVDVTLEENGEIKYEGSTIGTWLMYGEGYIKFSFTDTTKVGALNAAEEQTYYGVVRPAWLDDQNKSGFTITCMSQGNGKRSMAMFMNNYSTIGD